MWVCTGPFDGETGGSLKFQKSKLLKPGNSYKLGRSKKQPLFVNHKTVSSAHATFEVGSYSEDDAANPDYIPSLKVTNTSPKLRKIKRGDEYIPLDSDCTHELRDGDEFMILQETAISVRWEKVCCYSAVPRDLYQPPMKGCAELGISVVVCPHPNVTHHLVTSYTLQPAIAASLLSLAHLVKPEWLSSLLSLGVSEDGSSSLERSYSLPRVSDHRPEYSPSIPSTLKSTSSWEPNESRADLFRGHRIIFIGEKGREASSDEKDLVKRGGGDYECFAVGGGRKAFHNILAKGNAKSKDLVLVADEHLMGIAIGEDSWMEFVQEAAEFQLKFVRPEKLVSAVVHIDMSYIDCKLQDSDKGAHRFASPLPDVVPNTLADEPSYQPSAPSQPIPQAEASTAAPRKPLLRRRAAAPTSSGTVTPAEQPAPTPAPAPGPLTTAPERESSPAPPARRKLTRRAKTPAPPPIIGIDDPSILLEGPGDIPLDTTAAADGPVAPQIQMPPPVPPTPRNRLKRRVAGATQSLYTLDIDLEQAQTSEPPHKKFKELYEQSDPDKIAQSGMEEYRSMFTQKQSITQSEAEPSGVPLPSRLNVVPEEEEESGVSMPVDVDPQSPHPQSDSQAQKRKAVDDAEMDDENPRNRQRSEEVVIEKPKSKALGKTKVTVAKAEKGKAGGKTDKDDAFLKAVASTKRGKKKEDDFDREFNNLRISKPDLKRDEAANEWSVLEQFGDDSNLRGNFMVVVEMEVFRPDGRRDQSVYRRGEGRMEWEGKPDFKKFRKKAAGERRAPIELVVEQEPEFSFGTALQLDDSQGSAPKSQKRKARPVDSDSDDGTSLPLMKRRNTKATATSSKTAERASVVQNIASGSGTRAGSEKPAEKLKLTQRKGKEQALFLESDDESEKTLPTQPSQSVQQDDSDVEVVRTTRPARKAATQARKKPVDDDDSDDGLAFKGFGNRRRR